jgi:predicted nucleic acid-binding protein
MTGLPSISVRAWFVLVALDTNVVDLVEIACSEPGSVDAMEAMEPPPRFEGLAPPQEVEAFACYWLLAMAPVWRSTLYTFADLLYDELRGAPHGHELLRIALDVLVRDEQEVDYRQPDPSLRPTVAEVMTLGLKEADATHIADAIGLRCGRFLTNDRRLHSKSDSVERRWHLALRRPSEFLVEAVRAGAPWTTHAPWPWESVDRIRRGQPIMGASDEPAGR